MKGDTTMSITAHQRVLSLLIAAIPMFQVYAQVPQDTVLQNTTIQSTANVFARNSITAGPNFAISTTGDLTLHTGRYIYFRNGITITQGGKLHTIRDPSLTSVRTIENTIPANFSLQQNYPNPFNPSTNIRFAMKEKSHVSLVVLNLLGQTVATLVNETLPAGEYEVLFSTSGLASGLYLYRMTANAFTRSRTMLLLK
jgi:hypothetical protein